MRARRHLRAAMFRRAGAGSWEWRSWGRRAADTRARTPWHEPAWLYCTAASINLWRLTKTMSNTTTPAESHPASVPAETTAVPAGKPSEKDSTERAVPDPTRYGDWEKNGRCIDF
ncbi:DUF1674 domain-containing protein [Rhodanobacter sp. FDAARGOS 1247]|uniref:DUF1674 domain-containing protein n=1 Tax=Rhodanobacter sp. FDAARGOS 1247 TaxID=2778082 RepID=UPI0034E085A6